MSDQPTQSVELLLLCGKVRDEVLTAEDAGRLDVLLQASDQAKQLYVHYMSVVSLLESRGLGQPATASDAPPSDVMDHDVFAELLAYEEQADAQLVHQVGLLRSRGTPRWQVAGALQWTIQKPAVLGSIAAMLFFALVLAVVLSTGSEPTPIAVEPGENTTPPILQTVATLTASHNARWAEGALAAGSSLQAGQYLTLTQGFAEITTNDGAVAILEAPASIELLDNQNALRLHSGKLVGICETESSKGFLVHTQHIDVTDLGTRFGVSIDDSGRFSTEVFSGRIRVQPAQQRDDATVDFDAIELQSSDAIDFDPIEQQLTKRDIAPALFAKLNAYTNRSSILISNPSFDEPITHKERALNWTMNIAGGYANTGDSIKAGNTTEDRFELILGRFEDAIQNPIVTQDTGYVPADDATEIELVVDVATLDALGSVARIELFGTETGTVYASTDFEPTATNQWFTTALRYACDGSEAESLSIRLSLASTGDQDRVEINNVRLMVHRIQEEKP